MIGALICLGIAVFAVLVATSRENKLAKRRAEYERDLANRMKIRGMARSAAPKSQDSAKYKKLLAMCGGDRATADRLVFAYGIDKAIYDLIRDRHRN
jgi:hypothetical protein